MRIKLLFDAAFGATMKVFYVDDRFANFGNYSALLRREFWTRSLGGTLD